MLLSDPCCTNLCTPTCCRPKGSRGHGQARAKAEGEEGSCRGTAAGRCCGSGTWQAVSFRPAHAYNYAVRIAGSAHVDMGGGIEGVATRDGGSALWIAFLYWERCACHPLVMGGIVVVAAPVPAVVVLVVVLVVVVVPGTTGITRYDQKNT